VDASFLAAQMLKRIETLRRTLPKVGKPYDGPKAKSKKALTSAAAKRGREIIDLEAEEVVAEEEEGDSGTTTAAAASSSSGSATRHKIPRREAAAAAASSSSGPVKMKWDAPASGDLKEASYDDVLDRNSQVYYEKNPIVPKRLEAEDARLIVTGPYREPEPIKVEDWHQAIRDIFNFPVR